MKDLELEFKLRVNIKYDEDYTDENRAKLIAKHELSKVLLEIFNQEYEDRFIYEHYELY